MAGGQVRLNLDLMCSANNTPNYLHSLLSTGHCSGWCTSEDILSPVRLKTSITGMYKAQGYTSH